MGRALVLLLLIAAAGCSKPAREPAGDGRAETPSNLLLPPDGWTGGQAGPTEPDYPTAIRQPTRSEADRIAASCGTRARPATMQDGLLRLAAWAAYQPVDATPAQARCFYHRIRLLAARPAPGTITR